MEKNTKRKVDYTPSQWFIERWKKICGEEESDRYYLNKGATIGIPKFFRRKYYLKFGKIKILWRPRKKDAVIVLGKDYGISARDFFLAMRVLRRRKYITIGVYTDRPEKLPELFVISSRRQYIFLAPTIYLGYYYPLIDLDDLVEEVPEGLKTWRLMRNLSS